MNAIVFILEHIYELKFFKFMPSMLFKIIFEFYNRLGYELIVICWDDKYVQMTFIHIILN